VRRMCGDDFGRQCKKVISVRLLGHFVASRQN
jgi:hypothetical protein